MKKKMTIALLLVLIGLFSFFFFENKNDYNNLDELVRSKQRSGSFMVNYARIRCNKSKENKSESKEKDEQKLIMLSDINIKDSSYSFLNKIFFILSVVLSVSILLWPLLDSIIKGSEKYAKYTKHTSSAIMQTTITAAAALSFAFYSQYKDKQLSSENLMRYVLFSSEQIEVVNKKVIEEMQRIDKGFLFSDVIGKSKDGSPQKEDAALPDDQYSQRDAGPNPARTVDSDLKKHAETGLPVPAQ